MPTRTPAHYLVATTIGVTIAFVGATLVTQRLVARIDANARPMGEETAPDLDALTSARGFLRRMEVSLEDAIVHAARGEPTRPDRERFEQAKRSFDEKLAKLRALPRDSDEVEFINIAFREAPAFERDLSDAVARAEAGELMAARTRWETDVVHQAETVDSSLEHLVAMNAKKTSEAAARIRHDRGVAARTGFILTAATALLAMLAMILAVRASRWYGAMINERAEELDQFASRVAHDVISPLGAIRIALQICEKDSDEKTHRIVARGLSALERTTRIVNGLLDFARAGGRPDKGASCDISSIARAVIDEMRPAADGAGVQVEARITDGLAVACDQGVATVLISNLLRNAIKYTATDVRRVEVRVKPHDSNQVRVEVDDTGPGIPSTMHSQVFEPYVRATESSQPGIGLGLATVKRAVEAHGGRVGLASTVGNGSCFWFELPAAPVKRPKPAANQPSARA